MVHMKAVLKRMKCYPNLRNNHHLVVENKDSVLEELASWQKTEEPKNQYLYILKD